MYTTKKLQKLGLKSPYIYTYLLKINVMQPFYIGTQKTRKIIKINYS